MNRKRVTAGILSAVAILAMTTACGSNNFRDLNGVTSLHPDYVENYDNMDKHPNIGLICIRGVGFVTTTRDYTAIQRVPQWDSFCKQFKSHPVIHSQESENR